MVRNNDFKKGVATASFAILKPVEFRFLRLTQTGRRHNADNILVLDDVEFFGILSE
jgi:hypothetical protein